MSTPSSGVVGLLDSFLEEDLDDHPVRATGLGASGRDDRLGEFDAPSLEDRERRHRAWLSRFDECEESDLGAEDILDLELVRAELRGRVIMQDWQEWRRSPEPYLSASLYGLFLLFLQRTRPEAELIPDAVARLRSVPEVLAAGRANLDPDLAHSSIVRRSLGMCQAGSVYVRDFLPAEVDDPASRDLLVAAGAKAADAFDDFAEWLAELADVAAGEFAIGEERYSRLLREREGLGDDARGLRRRGQAAYEELTTEMRERARDLEGTDDFRGVIGGINENHPDTPEEMRELYEEWTARARAFLAERNLVSFPEGERCEVVPSPPFQRPVLAVASYSRPPSFTDSRVGHFFVPFPPAGSPEHDIQQRLSMNSRAIIPSISVHEAYPGHHWHLATAAGHPSRVRKVYGTPYLAEGWGLYTEQMMREQGFFPDPRMELLQLDMRLFRAARIVADVELHTGAMTPEDAAAYMGERAGLTEPVARAEVARYCAWPTQAASYLTGSLEIERIRARYLDEDRGDLRRFHDTLAGSGTLPLALAERAVMET